MPWSYTARATLLRLLRKINKSGDSQKLIGLGNLGPEAALSVMEGKCLIFKEFAGLDAFPIVIDEKDPKEIIKIIKIRIEIVIL